jgi:hypothetical protein
MDPSYYDLAQICRNGHVANSMARGAPESNQRFCVRCGEPTITECETCQAPIRGDYFVPGVISVGERYYAPAYCHNCGAAYPWTQAGLAAAKELATTFENLTADEQEQLQSSVDDLVRDTPRTKVAESRFKRLLTKAGPQAWETMRGVLVEVVSESVKKSIFGG